MKICKTLKKFYKNISRHTEKVRTVCLHINIYRVIKKLNKFLYWFCSLCFSVHSEKSVDDNPYTRQLWTTRCDKTLCAKDCQLLKFICHNHEPTPINNDEKQSDRSSIHTEKWTKNCDVSVDWRLVRCRIPSSWTHNCFQFTTENFRHRCQNT